MATYKSTESSDAAKAEHNFLEVLRSFHEAMLVTHGAEIGLHARPMAIAGTEADGAIWFVTGADMVKVNELEKDRTLLAVMQSPSKFLTVGGLAEFSRDRATIHRLWKEAFRVWFSDKDDPNILLVRLNPIEAEYWDRSGLKGAKFVLKVAASVLSGRDLPYPTNGDVDSHAKLNL